LLVDDEVIIRKLARNTLSSQNYEILEAADGEEALRMVRQEHPDLVLLDVRMPGRNGFEVCRAIKGDPETADILVIMLTAELMEEDMQEGLSCGATDFFTKPFSPLELMSKIKEYLDNAPAVTRPHHADRKHVPPLRTYRTPEDLRQMEREQLLLYADDLGKIFREEQEKSTELKAAYEKLKGLEKMKDVFISLVSHELRTPLSIIKGYVHLMDEVLRTNDVAEELRDFMGAILQSSDRLEELIQELLDFSKMKSGLVTFEKREIDIPSLLQLIVHEVVPLARERRQQFKIDVKTDFRPLKVDADRLKEALLHLMRNAVNFTPEEGTIRVECEDEGVWVKIRVTDSGPGIGPEEIDKIFAPFYQAADYMSRSIEGLGLGLSIAKHIVEDHGGTIAVESEVGKGATFVITLPRSYQDAKEMVADFQEKYPRKIEDLSRNLQATEKRLLGYAQDLASRLAQEKVRAQQLTETVGSMEQTYLETIAAFANMADLKDAYNLGHTDRVAFYAAAIAREFNPNLLEERDFKYSLLLHDLGKIGIAEDLLKKAGRLTDAEWETLKSHSELGVQLLSPVKFLAPALASVRSHHERWDGKGYPDGLEGEEIPVPARIIAVADAFEAMTTDRPYRPGMGLVEAREEIVNQSGTQFDPEVTEAFVRAWPAIQAWHERQQPAPAATPGTPAG
ncbi:MAG: response regulator, partial [Armatimonadetes bacterium]|nr:response regulator [Armatimonadota bacterium]